jgi:molybdopterin molybdotransferase
MLSVAEARAQILSQFERLPAESVALAEAQGRVLAADFVSTELVPPFANSSMDGYAVRVADVAQAPSRLPVSGDIPAGTAPGRLQPGTAMRIMTGAPVPDGADAVIPVEDTDDTRASGHGEPPPATIELRTVPQPGDNVRGVGQDVTPGQTVLAAGSLLGPAALGVLGALGAVHVSVVRRPRVALLSTGDELVTVAETPGPGRIRDINSITLAAALRDSGAEVLALGIVKDVRAEVEARFVEARDRGADLIVSSAGVSVGTYDVVKAAVEAHGALNFWKVNMRPGKPLAFGRVFDLPFFGLPGNPVSALVSLEVFLRPVMARLLGHPWAPRSVIARLAEPFNSDGRETYLRVRLAQDGQGAIAHLTGAQTSNLITSMVRADALLIVPAGAGALPAGTPLTAWLM